MQLFVRTHIDFYNTPAPINNKATIISKPEKYFYVAETDGQMATAHHHKQNSKHNRVVN